MNLNADFFLRYIHHLNSARVGNMYNLQRIIIIIFDKIFYCRHNLLKVWHIFCVVVIDMSCYFLYKFTKIKRNYTSVGILWESRKRHINQYKLGYGIIY